MTAIRKEIAMDALLAVLKVASLAYQLESPQDENSVAQMELSMAVTSEIKLVAK
jgi:hypothetical protein